MSTVYARRALCSWRSMVAVALVALILQVARSQAPSEVEYLTPSCSKRLDLMWTKYTGPTTWTDECDPACLIECSEVLHEAIYSTTSQACPLQTDITTCFNVYPDLWEEYVVDCELFIFEDSSTPINSTANTNTTGTGGATATAPTGAVGVGDAAAEGQSDIEAMLEDATAAAEATSDTPTGTDEGAPPAPPRKAAAEGEAGRRLLQAEGEGDSGSSSSSSNEGGSSAWQGGAGAGCFPDFKTVDDFKTYISGNWWTTEYSKPSDVAGIVMSVFFWLGLASIGFMVRN